MTNRSQKWCDQIGETEVKLMFDISMETKLCLDQSLLLVKKITVPGSSNDN
jgi:hypothetical protein